MHENKITQPAPPVKAPIFQSGRPEPDLFETHELAWITAETPYEFWRMLPEAYHDRKMFEMLEVVFDYPVLIPVAVLRKPETLEVLHAKLRLKRLLCRGRQS